MKRSVGTTARGILCPIIRENDDLIEITVQSILEASKQEQFEIRELDVIGVTESLLARAQGNYVNLDVVTQDIQEKMGEDVIAVVFPIFSRNRFSSILEAISNAAKKIILILQYPSDEVGNPLIDLDALDAAQINPYTDVLTLDIFRYHFKDIKHPFTKMDYVQYYEDILKKAEVEYEIIFSNKPEVALDYTHNILTADVHSNERTRRLLKEKGAQNVLGLSDILTSSINGSGYNEIYGLLGANRASETRIKLFPRDGENFVKQVQKRMFEETGKKVEVLVYGDGAFKDPIGHIWELADPTVAPYYTKGLEGTPQESKLKYLVDNEDSKLNEQELRQKLQESHKDANAALGTTPRRIVDLIGSLCDLVSGSGDKGTPVVLVQGYFDSYLD